MLGGVANADENASQGANRAYAVGDDDYFAVGVDYIAPNVTAGQFKGVFVLHFATFYNTRNNPNFQETVDGSLRFAEGAQPKMLVVLPPKDPRFSDNYDYQRDFPAWAASLADPRVNEKINLLLVQEVVKREEIFGHEIDTKYFEHLDGVDDFGLLYTDNLKPGLDDWTGERAPRRSGFRYCDGFEELIDGYDLVVAPFVCIADREAIIQHDGLSPRAEWPVDRYISRKKLYEHAVAELRKEEEDYRQALEQAPNTLSQLTLPHYRLSRNDRRPDGTENTGSLCSVAGVDELDRDVANLYASQSQGRLYPVAVLDDLDALFIDIQERTSSCRYVVLPVKQKEMLKTALERKNIAYDLPHHVFEFDNALQILTDFFAALEIKSREEYLLYKVLGFDQQVIAAFKSEGITTFAQHTKFKQRYEADFPSTDLGSVDGMLYAIDVKQKAEAQGQSVTAYLQAQQKAEAERREQQRIAARERAERRRATEKEKAKEFPYYAEVSCGVMGTVVDVRACFTDTTLTVSMNNITREKKGWELGDLGTMRGDVLVIDLTEDFFIKAQNSHKTLGITIDVKDRLTQRTVASDQAGDLYKLAIIRR